MGSRPDEVQLVTTSAKKKSAPDLEPPSKRPPHTRCTCDLKVGSKVSRRRKEQLCVERTTNKAASTTKKSLNRVEALSRSRHLCLVSLSFQWDYFT